jgi:hypothetical protein
MKGKTVKLKYALAQIKDRASQSSVVMLQLANNPPNWTAPEFISPQNFKDMVDSILPQENLLSLREAALGVAAGAWDKVLGPWHRESVTVLAMGRPKFRDTDKAPSWRNIRADQHSRGRIMDTGKDIIAAWEVSDALWIPKTGITLTSYKGRQAQAVVKSNAYDLAEKAVDNQRGVLNDLANEVYDLCVRWYELATGYWPEDTVEGSLIRTIPTSYNPDQLPGQLQFKLHLSPAPNSVQLGWEAARGEHYDIYALAPGAPEFVKILSNVTQTSWQGQGLAAGPWAFKGEAKNADGTGAFSDVIVVPVANAMAA